MSNFLRQTGSQHCLSVLVFSVLDMNPKGNVAAPETVNRGHDRSLYYPQRGHHIFFVAVHLHCIN